MDQWYRRNRLNNGLGLESIGLPEILVRPNWQTMTTGDQWRTVADCPSAEIWWIEVMSVQKEVSILLNATTAEQCQGVKQPQSNKTEWRVCHDRGRSDCIYQFAVGNPLGRGWGARAEGNRLFLTICALAHQPLQGWCTRKREKDPIFRKCWQVLSMSWIHLWRWIRLKALPLKCVLCYCNQCEMRVHLGLGTCWSTITSAEQEA